MKCHSSSDVVGEAWAWQEGNDEVPYQCSGCGEYFMEMWAIAIIKCVEGVPLLCLPCDSVRETGERITLTPLGMWMAGGV